MRPFRFCFAHPLQRLIAVLVVSVGLLPLAGLAIALADPPPTPFGTGTPPWSEVFARTGTGWLVLRSLGLALIVTALAVPVGTWFGWVEQRLHYRGSRVLSVLTLLPMAMPSYIVAATLREQFSAGGPAGAWLGVERFTGFWPSVICLTVITIPYVQLLTGAALARSSASEEEAARTLGAGRLQLARCVWLPRLRPAIAFSGLITALYVISDFGAVSVLDCPVLTWRLYQAVQLQQLASAAMLALGLLVVTLPLLVGAQIVRGRTTEKPHVANPRQPDRLAPGPVVLVITVLLQVLVAGLGVGVPMATLLQWVQGGLAHAVPFADVGKPVLDTLLAAGMGAAFVVALVWLPAWINGQRHGRLGCWLERAVFITSGLPGILLAFGLLLLALTFARAMPDPRATYRVVIASGGLLMIGYFMRFLAEGYAGVRTSVLAVDRRQLETARLLGAGWWRRAVGVVLPAAAPGVAVAFVVCAVAIMKELPVTLMLGSLSGTRTLAFRMYDRYTEAFLHDAGLAGLLLVVLSLAVLAVSLRWRRHA